MKIYRTQAEIDKDIKNKRLVVADDVRFECSFSISAELKVAGNIDAENINAENINAGNIDAENINAWDINAGNINAENINAGNIDAGNINAWDIHAWDINAWDINAKNINAGNILYWAFCCVINSIFCLSIKAKREKHHAPICLEGCLKKKRAKQ